MNHAANTITTTKTNSEKQPDASDITDEWHSLLFGVRRSIRYHAMRRQHYEHWQTISTVITLLSGSFAFTTSAGSLLSSATIYSISAKDIITSVCTGIIAINSAFTLAISPQRKAWEHTELSRKFIALEKKIINSEPNNENHKALFNERLDIEQTEPPILDITNIICHNDLARALGYDQSHFIKIGFFQRLFSPFFDFRAHKINTRRAQKPNTQDG